MIKKLILLITSLIICFPLFADKQIVLNTNIEGQLIMKQYYSQISEENDITSGEYYIDEDGVHSSLSEITNPFDLRAGFTTDDFIVTFFGSVSSNLSPKIEVTSSNYYLKSGNSTIFISSTPEIINKNPANGTLNIFKGIYYDSTNPDLPTFSFNIKSPSLQSVGAGRYFTDITISVSEY